MSQYVTNIIEFFDSLRKAGLKIGLSESMSAIEAIEYVGLENRSTVKIALSACLAKSEEDKRKFSQAFDEFFVGAQEQSQKQQSKFYKEEVRQKKLIESTKELQFQEEPLDLSEQQLEVYANLNLEEKNKIQDFLEKTSSGKNVSPKFKFVAEQVIKSKLNSVGAKSQQAGEGESGLLHKNIASISDDEVPQVIRLINIIVKRINGVISRKYKRTGKRKTLDIKATIHNSLNTGGVLFKLKFRSKPMQRQRLLLLCDISGSMYRFSGFALQFILGMATVADKTESFIFSEGIERVHNEDLQTIDSFEQRVTNSVLWSKGTNISTAFEFLLQGHTSLGSSTVVMIISDAKTLETKKTCDLLDEISKKSKKVVWLNPIPEKDWSSMSYIECFRAHCVMLDCSTIDRLASACAQSSDIFA